MSAKTDEILESLKSLSLLEASELVKQIEEAFGVSAAASAGVVMAAPALLPAGVVKPPRKRPNSTSSSKASTPQPKSRCSRLCAMPPAWVLAMPRLWWRLLPSPSRKASPRTMPKPSRRRSKKQAAKSLSSDVCGLVCQLDPSFETDKTGLQGPVFFWDIKQKKSPAKGRGLESSGAHSGVCPCFDPEEMLCTPHTTRP